MAFHSKLHETITELNVLYYFQSLSMLGQRCSLPDHKSFWSNYTREIDFMIQHKCTRRLMDVHQALREHPLVAVGYVRGFHAGIEFSQMKHRDDQLKELGAIIEHERKEAELRKKQEKAYRDEVKEFTAQLRSASGLVAEFKKNAEQIALHMMTLDIKRDQRPLFFETSTSHQSRPTISRTVDKIEADGLYRNEYGEIAIASGRLFSVHSTNPNLKEFDALLKKPVAVISMFLDRDLELFFEIISASPGLIQRLVDLNPDNRFDHIHLDIIELPEVNGLRYCLTMIDRFSRWPVAVPLANIEADTVATAFFNHWVAQFGTPLTITTDQGAQFESRLFTALAHMVGAQRIHTTPHHPQSNGLIERWHRTVKAALMCGAPRSWPQLLPTVLLGLRTCFKEDLNASPAQLMFGTQLRIPGEFFINEDMPADPNFFLEKFRDYIRSVRPTPTAHHTKQRPFILKDLYVCSHVFVRMDAVKRPLDPPYSEPHKIIRRVDGRVFIIDIDETEKAISIDRLKPVFSVKTDADDQQASNVQPQPDPCPTTDLDRPLRTYSTKKKESFPSPLVQDTGWRVPVGVSDSLLDRRSDPSAVISPKRRQRKQALVPRRESAELPKW